MGPYLPFLRSGSSALMFLLPHLSQPWYVTLHLIVRFWGFVISPAYAVSVRRPAGRPHPHAPLSQRDMVMSRVPSGLPYLWNAPPWPGRPPGLRPFFPFLPRPDCRAFCVRVLFEGGAWAPSL